MLRSRAGITPPHSPPPGDRESEGPAPPVASGSGSSSVPLSNGHINLFADLEEHASALAARASKSKPALTDTDRGLALAPTKQDLNPWYSSTTPKDSDGDKTAAARRYGSFSPSHPRAARLNYVMTLAGSAIWPAKFEPTPLLPYLRISCDLPARPLPRFLRHPTTTHRLAATRTLIPLNHSLHNRSLPHRLHHAKAALRANLPSENVR